jgi:hypothetical protein
MDRVAMKGRVAAVQKAARFGGVMGVAALALVGVGVVPAAADGPGSTTIATGATAGASLVLLSDGNWGVAMGATGFAAGGPVVLTVKDVSQPALPVFFETHSATSTPTTYCSGYFPCVVYPAGSILPVTVSLEKTTYSGGVVAHSQLVGCGDSLIAYAVAGDGPVSSTAVALNVPACPPVGGAGGGAGGGGGGRPPIHLM